MKEDMALNAREKISELSCAPCSNVHYYLICSYAIKSGGNVNQELLNSDVNTNALS